jgi:hypothetical protein
LARAKYEQERYRGLVAYASGLVEDFDAVEFKEFSFVFHLSARALAMAAIFMRVMPRLKALEDEIKKLGSQKKEKSKEEKHGKK